MKTLFRSLTVIIILVLIPSMVQAKEIKYNHSSIEINEVKKKVDYKVFVPKNIPENWTLETKTYPMGNNEIGRIALRYMAKNDRELMVTIIEAKKAPSSFYSNDSYEEINLGDGNAYFKRLFKSENILCLCFIKDGTYIQMLSQKQTKEEMIQIAKSMR